MRARKRKEGRRTNRKTEKRKKGKKKKSLSTTRQPVPALFQDRKRPVGLEVLKLHERVRESLLHGVAKLDDGLHVVLVAQPRLPDSQVRRVLQKRLAVGPSVEDDGHGVLRVEACPADVELDLARGDAEAADAEVAEAVSERVSSFLFFLSSPFLFLLVSAHGKKKKKETPDEPRATRDPRLNPTHPRILLPSVITMICTLWLGQFRSRCPNLPASPRASKNMPCGVRYAALNFWHASPTVGVYTTGASSSRFSIRTW